MYVCIYIYIYIYIHTYTHIGNPYDPFSRGSTSPPKGQLLIMVLIILTMCVMLVMITVIQKRWTRFDRLDSPRVSAYFQDGQTNTHSYVIFERAYIGNPYDPFPRGSTSPPKR